MEVILALSGIALLVVLFVAAPRVAITLVCLPFALWIGAVIIVLVMEAMPDRASNNCFATAGSTWCAEK